MLVSLSVRLSIVLDFLFPILLFMLVSVRLTVVLVSVSDYADLCLFLSLYVCLLYLFFCFRFCY